MTLLAVPVLALAEKMPQGAYPSSKFEEARKEAVAEGPETTLGDPLSPWQARLEMIGRAGLFDVK